MPHLKKATDAEILEAYHETNSIWKTGDMLGMCGQSVWERLRRMGVKLNNSPFPDAEIKRIKEVYESGIVSGDGKLEKLSIELNRTIPLISRTAGKLGLTSYNRKCADELKEKFSKNTKQYIEENGHPKGFLGHHHSKETLNLISTSTKKSWSQVTEEDLLERQRKSFKTRVKNGTLQQNRKKASWKQQWATIGGKKHYFRSQWEVNYAIYLEFLKTKGKIIEWLYEPETFWFETIKRGVRSYKPDFKVTENNGDIFYHEVKGWMDARSKTTIKRFGKYYPHLKLILIQAKQYNEILKKFSFLYK